MPPLNVIFLEAKKRVEYQIVKFKGHFNVAPLSERMEFKLTSISLSKEGRAAYSQLIRRALDRGRGKARCGEFDFQCYFGGESITGLARDGLGRLGSLLGLGRGRSWRWQTIAMERVSCLWPRGWECLSGQAQVLMR